MKKCYFTFSVQKEKEMELSNARNNFETELKRKVSEAQKNVVIEHSKSSEMEIRKIKEKYEQEFKAKEEAQVEVCKNYQQRDQAWQSEKQVTNIALSMLYLFIYTEIFNTKFKGAFYF